MAKRKLIDRSVIRTRLADEDYLEFRRLADSQSISQGQLARQAIVFFLRARQQEVDLELQAPLVRQAKSSTERICALLVKIAIDTRTHCMYSVGLNGEESLYQDCRNRAVKTIVQKLNDTEKSMADAIARIITSPDLLK